MFQIECLKKQYLISKQPAVNALNGISLEFPDTGFVALIGRNGSGKTTLLNMLGAIDRPSEGKIIYNGKDIFSFSSREADLYRNREIAFVFQDYNLIREDSVENNVKLALRLQLNDEKKISELTADALKRVGLAGFEKRKIEELSGGQKQRVVIARAVAKSSRVILCDEPTGNVDSESAESLFILLRELSADHLVITVTHDILLAEMYCERVIQLKDGKIEKDTANGGKSESKKIHTEENVKPKNNFSLRSVLYYAARNLKRGIVISLIAVLILAICFTFMFSFYSLSKFDGTVAMYNTMKANGAYTVSATKYIDRVFWIGKGMACGPSREQYKLNETDIEDIKKLVGDKAEVYSAYIFSTPLDYFTESNPSFVTTKYLADCFNEIVAVPSFDSFRQKLAYGKYPTGDNQILIYDYMAYNMLRHGGFIGADEIRDFVGYKLTDKFTGWEYEISGILKSNYELYSYVDEEWKSYDFEELYLSSLQTVFALSDLVEQMVKTQTQPVKARFYEEYVYSPEEGDIYTKIGEPSQSPLYVFDNDRLSEFCFIGDFNPRENDSGIIMPKKKFAEVYGISEDEVTPEYVNDAIKNKYFELELWYPSVDRTLTKHYQYGVITGVCGVYDGEDEKEYLYLPNGFEGTFEPDMMFRQFYISLSGTDGENLETVRKLTPVTQSFEFYSEHQDYYKEGFMIYTPYQEIIDDAVIYLDGMNSLGKTLFFVSMSLVCAAVLGYGYLVIKKRKFEIGLFKSLGTGNGSIALIFGTEVIMIVLISVIVGIIGAPILMNIIDKGFTSSYVFPISFFRIKVSDYILPCLIGMGTALIALLIPIMRLLRLQPAVIMNRSQK